MKVDNRFYDFPTASDWVTGVNGRFNWKRWVGYKLHDLAEWWLAKFCEDIKPRPGITGL